MRELVSLITQIFLCKRVPLDNSQNAMKGCCVACFFQWNDWILSCATLEITKVSLQDKILLGIHCQLKLFDLVTLDFSCKLTSTVEK